MSAKSDLLTLLQAFAYQRPGLEPGNYISGWSDKAGRAAYFAEQRSITRDLHDARELLGAVAMRDSIGADALRDAFRAFSGRLTLTEREGRLTLDYCTGQYFPTEYRKAVCAVLRAALWDFWRTCTPEDKREGDQGQWRLHILAQARGSLSPGVYRRWFRGA